MSVCPHVSAQFSLDGFSLNFIFKTYVKFCGNQMEEGKQEDQN
jgi:hypothetical protein